MTLLLVEEALEALHSARAKKAAADEIAWATAHQEMAAALAAAQG